jgi:hypothetical protein
MNLEFEQLMRNAEGRYFTDDEEKQLRGYAQGIERRIETMRAIERAEEAILDDVLNAVLAKYPSVTKRHGDGTDERIRRDQMMVLRYAAFAMLVRDPDYMHQKISVWLRTIMFALCKSEEVSFGYRQLAKAVKEHLTPEDSEQILPFLQVHIDEFTSVRSEAAA